MTDKLRFSRPKTATTSDLVDAAVKTVEQQLAAKSPVSGIWGFAKDGEWIAWATSTIHTTVRIPAQVGHPFRFEVGH